MSCSLVLNFQCISIKSSLSHVNSISWANWYVHVGRMSSSFLSQWIHIILTKKIRVGNRTWHFSKMIYSHKVREQVFHTFTLPYYLNYCYFIYEYFLCILIVMLAMCESQVDTTFTIHRKEHNFAYISQYVIKKYAPCKLQFEVNNKNRKEYMWKGKNKVSAHANNLYSFLPFKS